jgi:hypothetical protein
MIFSDDTHTAQMTEILAIKSGICVSYASIYIYVFYSKFS